MKKQNKTKISEYTQGYWDGGREAKKDLKNRINDLKKDIKPNAEENLIFRIVLNLFSK